MNNLSKVGQCVNYREATQRLQVLTLGTEDSVVGAAEPREWNATGAAMPSIKLEIAAFNSSIPPIVDCIFKLSILKE
eukprot:scaffold2939_cov406-Prasinococcus_capsulatus_cf.AAC.10